MGRLHLQRFADATRRIAKSYVIPDLAAIIADYIYDPALMGALESFILTYPNISVYNPLDRSLVYINIGPAEGLNRKWCRSVYLHSSLWAGRAILVDHIHDRMIGEQPPDWPELTARFIGLKKYERREMSRDINDFIFGQLRPVPAPLDT